MEKTKIDLNSDIYSSEAAFLCDGSYQALMCGLMKDDNFSLKKVYPIRNVYDNYVFIRRFFSKWWGFYILVIRILSFNNPFLEIFAFLKSIRIVKVDFGERIFTYPELSSFESSLLKSTPKVSIIIPTLNRYSFLRDTLHDLEKQTYRNFEVIIVDQSDDFQESFYKEFVLDMRVFFQTEKALWLARNTAIKKSDGEYILFFDDDSLVEPDWIEQHLVCLDFFKADISSGISISKVGDKIPAMYSYFKWSDQLDTGNVLMPRLVFEKVGLFDRQFEKMRMGDGEFGLRCMLKGLKNVSNPKSKRIHLKAGSGGLREMGSWDAFRSKKLFSPRPVPSVLYLVRRYFGRTAAIYYLVKLFPTIIVPYSMKGKRYLMLLSMVIGFILFPFLMIPIVISWRISSKMIHLGPLIEVY